MDTSSLLCVILAVMYVVPIVSSLMDDWSLDFQFSSSFLKIVSLLGSEEEDFSVGFKSSFYSPRLDSH